MQMINIGIIDYGASNINSLSNMLEYLDCRYEIITEKNLKNDYDILVIPGMGSSKYAIEKIVNQKMIDFINNHIKNNKKLIGICLGYQLFAENLIEGGSQKGLNLIKGKIIQLSKNALLKDFKIPIVGWYKNQVNQNFFDTELLKLINDKSYYFAHSYGFFPEKINEIVAYNNINELKIPSFAIRKNIIGIQFHPELSGINGVKLFKYIINYKY